MSLERPKSPSAGVKPGHRGSGLQCQGCRTTSGAAGDQKGAGLSSRLSCGGLQPCSQKSCRTWGNGTLQVPLLWLWGSGGAGTRRVTAESSGILRAPGWAQDRAGLSTGCGVNSALTIFESCLFWETPLMESLLHPTKSSSTSLSSNCLHVISPAAIPRAVSLRGREEQVSFPSAPAAAGGSTMRAAAVAERVSAEAALDFEIRQHKNLPISAGNGGGPDSAS